MTIVEAPTEPLPADSPPVAAPPAGPPAPAGAVKPVRPPKPPKPPRPPRRAPRGAVVYVPLSPARVFGRTSIALLAILVLGFVVDVTLLSRLQHASAQQQLLNAFREQLAEGTAPVSEGDVDGRLLADGAPVALLRIPQLGLDEVVVEGTSASALMSGPGHRRDSVLPGQIGLSTLMGRAAAFGGPFAGIESLQPGEMFTVITGQGASTFKVIGVRYAGDARPPGLSPGESRLQLVTARGPAFMPSGIAYLDAVLVGSAQEAGGRQTTGASLPPSHEPLATDTSTAWALVFALQFLLLVEGAAVWTIPRIGGRKAWIVFTPLVLVGGLWSATQIVFLLPNLL